LSVGKTTLHDSGEERVVPVRQLVVHNDVMATEEFQAAENNRMEPQHFKPKRWVRLMQTVSGGFVIMMGASAVGANSGSIPIGIAALLVGTFTLGQGLYSEVIATEDDLRVRRNIWKPVITAWEDIDFCMPGNPLACRLIAGKTLRLIPLLHEPHELRALIDDTVGPPPAKS